MAQQKSLSWNPWTLRRELKIAYANVLARTDELAARRAEVDRLRDEVARVTADSRLEDALLHWLQSRKRAED